MSQLIDKIKVQVSKGRPTKKDRRNLGKWFD